MCEIVNSYARAPMICMVISKSVNTTLNLALKLPIIVTPKGRNL